MRIFLKTLSSYLKGINWKIGLPLLLIIFLGSFLRLYRHNDLLHFELDQARDAIIIHEAIDKGPGELPLLGPRAAGTMLRLGPFFYYFSYLSALIFNNLPAGINYLGLLVSIASIPLFFYFLKLYFSRRLSLLVTGIFSFSLFLVTYGRFAWNPNMLPFFVTLSLVCLICFFNRGNRRNWYLYGGALALAIVSQLHFLSFVIAPLVALLFWVWQKGAYQYFFRLKKRKDQEQLSKLKNLKRGFLACLIVVVVYCPVFINESLTGGDNAKEFLKAVTEKTEKNKEHNLGENIFRNFQEYSRGYLMLISGNERAGLMDLDLSFKKGETDLKCGEECRRSSVFILLGLIFFGGGLVFIFKEIFGYLRNRHLKPADKLKLDFLVLNLILWGVSFGGFLSVAFKFPPRFLLVTVPVAFVFLALWLKNLEKLVSYLKFRPSFFSPAKTLSLVIILFLSFTNFYYNFKRFQQQAKTHTGDPIYFEKDLVLKEDIRFTLLQQKLILDWIGANSSQETVFVWAPPKYYRPFTYQLNYLRDKRGKRLRYSIPCKEADYFTISRKEDGSDYLDEASDLFTISKGEDFGTLKVFKLEPQIGDQKIETQCPPDSEKEDPSYARRYKWKEIGKNK